MLIYTLNIDTSLPFREVEKFEAHEELRYECKSHLYVHTPGSPCDRSRILTCSNTIGARVRLAIEELAPQTPDWDLVDNI
ncbi:hypothetical protein BV22DRAFT_1034254 [Leucogyrophana mollusca]|uniref:Uncharacterized protein n=1 Tax=Leucogyrophana mollusca TaxID=85980 RepID=A0ACB8BIS0_9AGAM|nr:hypothetical protein BV22DRAFT_1034254 [Leucogyrophana mollusca]